MSYFYNDRLIQLIDYIINFTLCLQCFKSSMNFSGAKQLAAFIYTLFSFVKFNILSFTNNVCKIFLNLKRIYNKYATDRYLYELFLYKLMTILYDLTTLC